MARKSAFTLVELMIVLTVVAIMAAMSMPTFQHAIEQSRGDVAAANLRAIWAAERLYWLENHQYTGNLEDLRSLQNGEPSDSYLHLGLLDPTFAIKGSSTYATVGYYNYYQPIVTQDASGNSTFTVTATSNSGDAASITIDQTGSIAANGIALGFQFQ